MSDFQDDNIISMDNFLKDEESEAKEATFRNEVENVREWTKQYFTDMRLTDMEQQTGINSMYMKGKSKTLNITVTVTRRN